MVTHEGVGATCTEPGLTAGNHCSVCNVVLTAQEAIAAAGHGYIYTPIGESSHSVTCENCVLSQETAHSYTEGKFICRQEEEKEPVLESGWKMGHTLDLAADISVNFAVSKFSLTGFDMDAVYILSRLEVYEGNTKTGTETIKLLPVEQGNYYYFTLTGLTAVNMNDRISYVLYGTKEGRLYYSATDDYSIADYAYSQMNKTNVPESL